MSEHEFKKEFSRYYLPLCMFALRMLNIKEEAEDVVQQCFIICWERLQKGERIDNLKSYLYISVRNLSLRRLMKLQSELSSDFTSFTMEITEEEIDTSERDAKLWKAIDNLPEKCRLIFLMSKRDGLSNKEISDELGISVKTVENQMTKAYTRLRESLSSLSHNGSHGNTYILIFF